MPKNVEQIYQKVSQLEHVLLRPDTYVGSVQYIEKTPMWVYDAVKKGDVAKKEPDDDEPTAKDSDDDGEWNGDSPKKNGVKSGGAAADESDKDGKIVFREIKYVPGLYKVFDEILVNAADNKQRDPKMNLIKIDINKQKNEISVWNNGKGIPVVMHKVEKMYVPELIFGTLLTSSNYNDDERKVTGGRNGYGAKLCNIFSKKFTVETRSSAEGKMFRQTWINNMSDKKGEPEIKSVSKGDDYTKITFTPDLEKFKMTELDDDIIALMSRRAYDVAGSVKGIRVFLNGKQLPCKGFKEYVAQYTKEIEHNGEPLKVFFDEPDPRWQIAVTVSPNDGFNQVSFANSIATTKGGRHVDYVVDQITASLMETIKKKTEKSGVKIKSPQIKNSMWVFVNALIENPTFDSQTKETMTLQSKDFGSKFKLSDKFLADVAKKSGIVESVLSWVMYKQQEQQDKQCHSKKKSKLKGIPKLEDANDAGTKNSHLCTLILTEGDSAKTLAVAGLGVIGRDRYGVFPLRGKMLNVRECQHKQVIENVEVNHLLKILGLQYKLKYTNEEEMKTLRYGKVMIMTDQDQDGSHIKGLLINFIHHNWPALLRNHFLEEFITPIVKVTKGNTSHSFYSLPEYAEWRNNNDNWKSYKIKYYKGLGTSTAKEAKEYFTDMRRHRILFDYSGQPDDDAVILAFSKKKIEERKDWLTRWMSIRKERRERGQPDDYLYERNTRSVTFADFVNKELVLFSNMDNERSIPSLVDGLKPGQRKVIFTCFKRADKKEVKVAQLAGAVGEMSAYHHGEQSLMMTIINLAQDFVGSNNINLLLPNGQFGTRLQGGKDSASPRYIFTQLNPVTKTLFQPTDEHVLRFLFEENQKIEPEWYCPIIPTVLVNGAEGIGTGWSTKIPNYNPREVVENIRRLIRGDQLKPMTPWYKKFGGTIQKLDDTRYICSGEIATVNDNTIEITELPIKTWTQNYKENVLEPMLEASNNKPAMISDYKEYHTEETVKFVIKMGEDQLRQYEREGLHKVFKLQSAINTTSMVLFDAAGCLRKFNTPEEICAEFFETRKRIYIERKAYLEGMLGAQSDKLSEQARFILMKVNNQIQIENKRKTAIIEQLIKHGFKPDPVKAWKDQQTKKELEMLGEAAPEEEDEQEAETETEGGGDRRVKDYDYLVGMAIWKLSMEDKDKLTAESRAKNEELRVLQGKSWSDLWEADLKEFLAALEKQEEKEAKDLETCVENAAKALKKKMPDNKGGGRKIQRQSGIIDFAPSKDAIRVAPTLEAMKEKYEQKPKKEKDPNAPPKAPRKPREPKDPSKTTKQVRAKKNLTESNNGDIRNFVQPQNGADGDEEDGSTQMTTSTNDSPKENRKRPKTAAAKPKANGKAASSSQGSNTAAKKSPAKKATKSKPAPAKSKRAPAKSTPSKKKRAKKEWSSDEESAADLSSDEEDLDLGSEDDLPPPPPRNTAPRRAAATKKPKYQLSDDDDDEEDDAAALSDASEAEVIPAAKKARRVIDSDEDFD